jgi:hypothetical protein
MSLDFRADIYTTVSAVDMCLNPGRGTNTHDELLVLDSSAIRFVISTLKPDLKVIKAVINDQPPKKKKYRLSAREEFLMDLKILFERGHTTRASMAAALGIKIETLDRRIIRARKDGDLPPASGLPIFDPFGTVFKAGYYTSPRQRTTTRPKRPPQNSM